MGNVLIKSQLKVTDRNDAAQLQVHKKVCRVIPTDLFDFMSFLCRIRQFLFAELLCHRIELLQILSLDC